MSKKRKIEIPVSEKRLLDAPELMAYIGMGYTNAVRFGKAAGACKRFGGLMLFDRAIIDRAIDQTAATVDE